MCNVEGPPLKKMRPRLLSAVQSMPIYLDYNATTPLCDEAWEAMTRVRRVWGNPSSAHPYGLAAKYVLDEARQRVSESINARSPEEIIFTSGGTEANNLAIIGGALAVHTKTPERSIVVATTVEHPAVSQVLNYCEQRGLTSMRLAVDSMTGCVDVACWRKWLHEIPGGPKSVALVSVMHANNELGSVNDIAAIVTMVKAVCGMEVLVHTDAAQSIGKIPVDVSMFGVDLLSVCSHKFYGPKGIGALYVRRGVVLQSILFGAGHEGGLRPGTENVLLATGMAEALHLACTDLKANTERMRDTRSEFIRVMEDEMTKVGLWYMINGDLNCALPNTLNIALYRKPDDESLTQLPQYISAQRLIFSIGDRVCLSAGSACHSSGEKVSVSDALKGVDVDLNRAVGTLRISTGRSTTMEEVRRAARIIVRCAAQQFANQ